VPAGGFSLDSVFDVGSNPIAPTIFLASLFCGSFWGFTVFGRFVGGLHSVKSAKSLRAQPGGKVLITDGPYLETKEHIGGFWVLEATDMNEALEWGRKAAVACRAPVEVRQFHSL
jgi:hypothetical protein